MPLHPSQDHDLVFMSGHLIDDALLTDLIGLIYQSRRKAMIRLFYSEEDSSDTKLSKRYPVELYFLHGRVAYVSSANPYHRLGAILIRRGSITEVQLSKVLSSLSGQRLGDALIDSGTINRNELINALKDQAMLTLQGALMRRADLDKMGSSSFDHFTLSDYQESDLPLNLNIDAQGLLLEVLRQQDEVTALLRSLPPLNTCPKATRSPRSSDPSEVAFALQQCGGFTSLKTLIFMNPIGALDALTLYQRLLTEGLIKVKTGWSPLVSHSIHDQDLHEENKSGELQSSVNDEGWFDLCFTPDVDL